MTDMAGSLYAARSADDCGDGRGGFEDEFVAALLSGGDSRLAIDPRTGANKYLCRPTPARDLVCASSCTASPISEQSFRRAADLHASLVAGRSPGERADAVDRCAHDLEARLLTYFGANGLAEAILCPSGTDALQTATLLVGLERPDEKMTAILPQTSETGTGVPLAATLRPFDLPAASDVPLADCAAGSIAIPLRTEDGVPRSDDAVMEGFAFAVAGVKGRPVVYLTHGTKTGLIAPVEPPDGVDVIIDACQGRIEPATGGAVSAQWLAGGGDRIEVLRRPGVFGRGFVPVGPTGRCPTGRCPTGRCPTGRCPAGRCPTGRCPAGRCPTGRCPARDRPRTPPPHGPGAVECRQHRDAAALECRTRRD
jgi:hypothetical protein